MNRRIRHEKLSLATVMAITAAMALIFPYKAVTFRASPDPKRHEAEAAFVVLTEAQERMALTAAKASWQGDAGGVRHMRVDLAIGELPEDPPRPTLETRERPDRKSLPSVPFPAGAYLPSAQAVPPDSLPHETKGEESSPAFTRGELLKID